MVREVFEGAVVVLVVAFLVTMGFQVLAFVFGIVDYAQVLTSQYIPPDPAFSRWYFTLRDSIPEMATASLMVSLIAAFVYMVVAAQKRRYYDLYAS